MGGRGAATTGPAGGRPAMAGAGGVALGAMIWGPRRSICGMIRLGAAGCCEKDVAAGALGAVGAAGAAGAAGVDAAGATAGGVATGGATDGRVTTTPGRGGVATAGRCGGAATAGRCGGGGAAGGRECACCSACLRSRIAFSASPGFEILERSILGSLAAAERAPLDGAPPRRYVRTRAASSSSSELECVFFSVTPTAVKASRIDLLLTSSSRAKSLIRTLLIRPLFTTPCRLSRSYAASTLRDV